MFRRDKPITIKGSASSLCNNLAVFVIQDKRQLNYAVIHKSEVHISSATADGTSVTGRQVICKEPSATQASPFLLQVKWVSFANGRTVFVMTTQRSIQVFEPDGTALIFWHSMSDSLDKIVCSKGIAGVENNLCIGLETGSIMIFDVPAKGPNLTKTETIQAHESAICDVASDFDKLASSDGLGNINLFKFSGSNATLFRKIRGFGWPCNSLALWKNCVIGGYASGHLRVFNATTGILGSEVTAHARAINAIDVAKDNGMILSVSDDTYFRVWQLKDTAVTPHIEHRTSECVTNLQLVGGKFVDGQGRALCVTGYDSSEISFFVRG